MDESRAESTGLTKLETADAVFEALGGAEAVMALTCSKYKAVFNWKATGAFPPRTYVALTAALNERRYTAAARLWGMVPAANSPATEGAACRP